jgi:hypothetical protein
MTKQFIIYLFLGAIVNGLMFLVIPDYYFWFLVLLAIGTIILLTIIVADLLRKTKNWKGVAIWLGFGILSWVVGILSIIVRNYFLGYYSN